MASVFNGQGSTITISDDSALTFYEAISGYNPADPATDVGATLQDALGYWRTTGIGGHQILAFAQIDHTDLALVRACIALFGGVYAGFNVPQSAIDQFNAGKPWALPSRTSQIVGGHCVPILGYQGTDFDVVTWAKVQKMSGGFYKRYFDETWVAFSAEWLSRSDRRSPTGLDYLQLNADVMSLTGQPGPFQQGSTPPPDSGAIELIHTLNGLITAWMHTNS